MSNEASGINGNGEAGQVPEGKQLPAIAIGWDAEVQDVAVQFDPKSFKTYEFVIAVLDMAKSKMEKIVKMQHVQQLQANAAEAQRTQALMQKLKR